MHDNQARLVSTIVVTFGFGGAIAETRPAYDPSLTPNSSIER